MVSPGRAASMAAWIDSPGLTTWALDPPAQALPAGRLTSKLNSNAMVIFVQRRIRITYQMVGRTGSVAARFDNSKAVIPPPAADASRSQGTSAWQPPRRCQAFGAIRRKAGALTLSGHCSGTRSQMLPNWLEDPLTLGAMPLGPEQVPAWPVRRVQYR
jgi:hypothetical protein